MTDIVKVVRVIPASVDVVFEAWLDPKAIRVWMCPGDIFESIAEIDARVGGAYEIVMRSPRKDDRHWGRYVEIDRPRRLSFTWCSDSTDRKETLVSIELVPIGHSECELTLVHTDLPSHATARHRVGWKAHIRELIDFVQGDRSDGLKLTIGFYGASDD